MKHSMTAAAVVTLSLLASGCVIHVGADDDGAYHSRTSVEKTEQHNRDAIARMAIGTPVSMALEQMGQPDFSDLTQVAGREVRVLRYRTHRTNADGDTTRDETTPLVFVDGKLTGIGETAVSQAMTP